MRMIINVCRLLLTSVNYGAGKALWFLHVVKVKGMDSLALKLYNASLGKRVFK